MKTTLNGALRSVALAFLLLPSGGVEAVPATRISAGETRSDYPFVPHVELGAQLYREDALDLRLEYGLEANGDFRNQSATARLAWHF